jgi:DNA polymerase I
VHDELLFEVPEGQGEALAPRIGKIMESAASLSLPLTVEVSVGKNWGEIH